jgi:predicted Zn-dependent protease
MMPGVQMQELLEQALALSSVDGCIVIGEEHTEANLRWAANSLTTNGQMHHRKLSVISIVHTPDGTTSGVVSGPVTGADTGAELAALVSASEAAARAASPAEDAAPLVEPYPNDDDWESPAARTSIEVFADFAPALGRAFQTARDSDRLLYGFAEHILSSAFLATSTGIRRRFDQYTGRLELNAKSADLSRTAWIGQQTQDFSDIDIEAMASEVAQRLEWSRNQVELPAGRYETVLPPSAVADLMIFVYIGASARDAEEGRNAFAATDGSTKLGTAISPRPLNLYSDPAAAGMQCAPFQITPVSGFESVFDNGAPVAATRWISEGVMANLFRNRSWAARTGTAHVPLADNLILTETRADGSAPSSLQEMIASTKRGLLLTCLWYIRVVDPQSMLVTGSTRDGVYLIEDGVVTAEVNNFRFNESPVDLLGRVTEVGQTLPTLSREWSDNFTRTAMPTIRVPDFNMSTVSQAS